MHGTEIRIIRIFNTYGPRMMPDDGRVISNFIVQALRGENLTLYGNGSQTRSFCYVDDLIEGMILHMNSKEMGPFNVGNPREFSIKELAEIIREKINPNLEFINKPLPLDDPVQRQPVIDLARNKLGWEPKIELEDGIDKTIRWFKNFLS